MRADIEPPGVDEDRLREPERDLAHLPAHRRDPQQRLVGPGPDGVVRRHSVRPRRKQGELDRVHVLVIGLFQHMQRVNAA